MDEERRLRGAAVRKKLRTIPGVFAAVDHIHYIEAYCVKSEIPRVEKVLKEREAEWDGFEVRVNVAPDLRLSI